MTYLAVANKWDEWRIAVTFSRAPSPHQVERDYPNAQHWALVDAETPEHAMVVAERTAQRGERVYSGVAYIGTALAWRFEPGGQVRMVGAA